MKQFGTRRGEDCECTSRFTCRACLTNAPPYFYTPTPNKPNPQTKGEKNDPQS